MIFLNFFQNFTMTSFLGNFEAQCYYQEALKLTKGYRPIMEKLGEPVKFKPIDISDEFNYQDEKIARVNPILFSHKHLNNYACLRLKFQW